MKVNVILGEKRLERIYILSLVEQKGVVGPVFSYTLEALVQSFPRHTFILNSHIREAPRYLT